jgi:hypothetical protein
VTVNAHTGTDDDTGTHAQQLLDEMGTPGGHRTPTMAFPARVNPDSSSVCAAFGRLLLTTCAVTGCVILNGRRGGLGDGTPANVPGYTYRRSGSGVGGSSVID